MNSLVLQFDPGGSARGLYSELIDLRAVGSLDVTRASQVEFSNSKQQWEIRDLNGKLLFSNASRAVCLEWEQRNLAP